MSPALLALLLSKPALLIALATITINALKILPDLIKIIQESDITDKDELIAKIKEAQASVPEWV